MSDVVPDLVSTIIPAFNRPAMLREAVASVFAQTYRSFEVIIVDDGSTDDTPRVGETLAKSNQGVVHFIRKGNSGPGPTREAGRQAARGEFIQYLDSDDLLRPQKFELQVQALRDRPDCGAAYGYICVHPLNRPPIEKPYKGSGETRETLFPWLLADRWWNTDCPLFRRSVCDAVGPWTDLRWSQDWEYDGRVAALGTRLVHVKDFVCDERHHTEVRQTSHADWTAPERIAARIRFFTLMLDHAERGGIPASSPQRQHFTRWIFATARKCAYVGAAADVETCMRLAELSAGDCGEVRQGFSAFRSLCRWIGPRSTGRLLALRERLKRGPGRHTLQESFASDLR
ncbi:MAG: glycosyltransferase family 2 protein [Planctomycetia bacterium]|nr:glycosyltransferase family 2 protein [Planctomycetia bacterium]